jgi:hypothetical protein
VLSGCPHDTTLGDDGRRIFTTTQVLPEKPAGRSLTPGE